MRLALIFTASFTALGLLPARAVILFGLDNSANQTDPGTGFAFDSVGLLSDAAKANPMGSAIHLGDGYMLTANHVGMKPYVTFDGVTFYQRDVSFVPQQVAPNVDLKVFRLTATPTVAAVNLYAGEDEEASSAALVGWGLGRNPTIPVDSLAVTWGDNSTMAKRWGLNVPLGVGSVGYQLGSYDAIATGLGSDAGSPAGLGDNEAAATLYDSGSALFQNLGGIWYLIGLTTSVDTAGTSNFGNDQLANPNGDLNYFVRIGSYQADIVDLIPEPSGCGLLAGMVFVVLARRRVACD